MRTRSYWRIFTDAGTMEKARCVLRRVEALVGREFEELAVEAHHERGFVISGSLPHMAAGWPEVVVELLECAHRLSCGWSIRYDAGQRVDLTTAATHNAMRLAGVTFVHVECGKEPRPVT